jgi:hypothetical protein
LSFWDWLILTNFLYPFIFWWAARLSFHNLAIVNSTEVELGVQVSLKCWLTFLQDVPNSGIAGSYGSSVLVFWATSVLISIVSVLIYIHANST